MEFNEVVRSRRSIRKFKNDPIPDNMVREIIDAGRLAPSGLNVQLWRYVIVKSDEKRKMVSDAVHSGHAANAPILIICAVDTQAYAQMPLRVKELMEAGALKGNPFEGASGGIFNNEIWLKINNALNAAISIEHMVLKATDLGLGSCWLGAFDESGVKKAAELDEGISITALLAIGYPDELPQQRPRLPLNEIILKEI
ncbi:MAG TPA: nitroreductase family protein [Clostridia bacterium]|nr:nitroreductase family protein [Clostridia bacterium]